MDKLVTPESRKRAIELARKEGLISVIRKSVAATHNRSKYVGATIALAQILLDAQTKGGSEKKSATKEWKRACRLDPGRPIDKLREANHTIIRRVVSSADRAEELTGVLYTLLMKRDDIPEDLKPEEKLQKINQLLKGTTESRILGKYVSVSLPVREKLSERKCLIILGATFWILDNPNIPVETLKKKFEPYQYARDILRKSVR